MVYRENDPNRRFKDMIHQMKLGQKSISVHKKIANMRMSKSYVENIAHGIALAAQKGAAGEIYNLADLQVFSELDWARKIAGLMNWNGEIVVTDKDHGFEVVRALNLDQHLIIETSKIRNELGYQEIVPVETALLRTIQWELQR